MSNETERDRFAMPWWLQVILACTTLALITVGFIGPLALVLLIPLGVFLVSIPVWTAGAAIRRWALEEDERANPR